MSRRRVPSSEAVWERHVELVLVVLCHALEKLRAHRPLPRAEIPLNRRLPLKAREAYWELPERDRPQYFGLMPPAEQTPEDERDVDEDWVGKRPDFKWRMQDNLAQKTSDFDIECKRLGKPTSPNWVLTQEYVIDGIVRFLSASHRYGNGVSSGAMVGYVQDSEPPDILRGVNSYIRREGKHSIPAIRFPRNAGEAPPVMKTRQRLSRSEVSPSRFVLHHLWVDLRSN